MLNVSLKSFHDIKNISNKLEGLTSIPSKHIQNKIAELKGFNDIDELLIFENAWKDDVLDDKLYKKLNIKKHLKNIIEVNSNIFNSMEELIKVISKTSCVWFTLNSKDKIEKLTRKSCFSYGDEKALVKFYSKMTVWLKNNSTIIEDFSVSQQFDSGRIIIDLKYNGKLYSLDFCSYEIFKNENWSNQVCIHLRYKEITTEDYLNKDILKNPELLKKFAYDLKSSVNMKHSEILNCISKAVGFNNWHIYKSYLDKVFKPVMLVHPVNDPLLCSRYPVFKKKEYSAIFILYAYILWMYENKCVCISINKDGLFSAESILGNKSYFKNDFLKLGYESNFNKYSCPFIENNGSQNKSMLYSLKETKITFPINNHLIDFSENFKCLFKYFESSDNILIFEKEYVNKRKMKVKEVMIKDINYFNMNGYFYFDIVYDERNINIRLNGLYLNN